MNKECPGELSYENEMQKGFVMINEALKKDVGIVTFWESQDNYGQILQNFALVNFLQRLGYNAFLIKSTSKVKTSFFHKITTFIRLLVQPQHLKKYVVNFLLKNKMHSANQSHTRYFDSFRNKYIPSSVYYSFEDICLKPPKLYAYICGSDQIWNYVSRYYFLDFVPDGSKKIAYAASMGGFIPSKKEQRKIIEYLSSYALISLREESALQFIQGLGFSDAALVPDPTLLLNVMSYEKLCKKSDEPYLLLYLLGNKLEFNLDEIYTYARKKGLLVIYVASQGRIDNYEKEYPSVEEWLSLVKNASYVVTNSFHGTVFSLLFHKKFMTLLLSDLFAGMNDRIVGLLSRYNLKSRLYRDSFDTLDDYIDYSCFESVVELERDNAKKLLLDALES